MTNKIKWFIVNITKNRGYSALIFLLDFWRPAHSRRGQNFDYNTLPALLSRKNYENIAQKIIPKLVQYFLK
nr:MAG TPA: hypothetical protein [Caudoviricetes sp.]